MRTQEEIIEEYEKLIKHDELIRDPNRCNIYVYKNQDKRDRLQKEYEETLEEKYRMAILLHKLLCKENHTDRCFWFYERSGLQDKWEQYAHRHYLKKAEKLIDHGIHLDTLQTVLDCIK